MDPELATLSSELQTASDVQPDHSETKERHVAVQQHDASRAAATATPAPPAEAAQQPHEAARDAAAHPETDDTAQQPEPEAAVRVSDAAISVTQDLSISPDAPTPAQQLPTAQAVQQRSGHIDIPASPQQPVANSKRTAAAPPSPTSSTRCSSLSDAELPPAVPADAQIAAHAARPQQPSDLAAAEQPPQQEGPEHEDGEQGQQQDVQEVAQGRDLGRQGSHDEVGAEQPQQPEAELAQQQAQPSSSAAPAHRRNTPYICQVRHLCHRLLPDILLYC